MRTTLGTNLYRLSAVALAVPVSLSLFAGPSLAAAPDRDGRATAAGNSAGNAGNGAPSAPVPAAPVAVAPVVGSDKHGTASSGPLTSPQPLSNADRNGTGANPGTTCTHAYCSTRDGSASQNGNGGGEAGGTPCAGCVGRADNKNPAGQAPNGSDHNNGYECDGNNGIGKGNPAHTGCTATPVTVPAPTPTHAPNPSHAPRPGHAASPAPAATCSNGSPLPATGRKDCPAPAPTTPRTTLPSAGTPISGIVTFPAAAPVAGPAAAPVAGPGPATPVTRPVAGPVYGPPSRPATPATPATPILGVTPNAAVAPTILSAATLLSGTVALPAQAPAAALPTVQAPGAVAASLPLTGTDAALLVELAGLLLLVGGALVVTARRRPAVR